LRVQLVREGFIPFVRLLSGGYYLLYFHSSSGVQFFAGSIFQLAMGWNRQSRKPLNRVRVLLADDHHVLLERVASILAVDFDVIGSVGNGSELIAQAELLQPDVVIADISMPILNGINAIQQLLEKGSTAKFIFLTLHENPAFVHACFAAGALGYVVKTRLSMDLTIAVRAVLRGRPFLSPPLKR
jgi:CheY-like chemotaxis protein